VQIEKCFNLTYKVATLRTWHDDMTRKHGWDGWKNLVKKYLALGTRSVG